MRNADKINKILRRLSILLSLIGVTPRRKTNEKDIET